MHAPVRAALMAPQGRGKARVQAFRAHLDEGEGT
eukprot:CAMPEP_0174899746 /NCGR_PEP_ID=MMETSP0167-20121228/28506_1 /TAXON_ID=38298 /ORGANISM="Rhodella maculata, Strain CCMP736" /LENGTH=33 /DNA_ID= /DNA_START= /DNA_END= /DNA_ORIENTATION=